MLRYKIYLHVLTIEGFAAKRAYVAFRADFYFCRIELIFGGLTCVEMTCLDTGSTPGWSTSFFHSFFFPLKISIYKEQCCRRC